MNTLHFSDLGEFAEFFIDKYTIVTRDNDFAIVNVIGSYRQIKEIFEYLVVNGFPVTNIDLEEPGLSDYTDDFVLEFDTDGVCIEKAIRKDTEYGYFDVDGEGVYILAPSKFPIERANNGVWGKDSFGLHMVEIGDCCKCECHCYDKDEDEVDVDSESSEDEDDDKNVIHIKIEGLGDLADDAFRDKFDAALENYQYLFDLFRSFDHPIRNRTHSYF